MGEMPGFCPPRHLGGRVAGLAVAWSGGGAHGRGSEDQRDKLAAGLGLELLRPAWRSQDHPKGPAGQGEDARGDQARCRVKRLSQPRPGPPRIEVAGASERRIDPAHLIPRSLGGCGDVALLRAAVPLAPPGLRPRRALTCCPTSSPPGRHSSHTPWGTSGSSGRCGGSVVRGQGPTGLATRSR